MCSSVYYENSTPSYFEFCCLWQQNEWGDYNKDRYDLVHSNQPIVVCARIDDMLVGYARLLTDYAMYGYIQDVMVHKKYQRVGIGTSMVIQLRNSAEELQLKFLGLFATTDAIGFYNSLGFSTLCGKNSGLGVIYD